MRTRRIGCFSATGLIAALLTLLAISSVALAQGGVLFSPGPLNAQAGAQPLGGVYSHDETGGRCSACHTAIWESERMADRCLICHQDLITSPDNFHSVMLEQSVTWQCHTCHTEHNGPGASLTILDMQRFPHEATGFSLQGHKTTLAGVSFACLDCHGDRITTMDPARCLTCHQEIDPAYMENHLAAFGGSCLACHDGVDTYGAAFDHNLQAFPLQGKHADVDCAACHPGARAPADLKNAPTDCFSCHAQDDPHAGRFGQDCAQCHTPEGWENAAFDHSLAAFPLTGAHVNVACADCHTNGLYKGTPQACSACHAEPEYHSGMFGGECSTCHDTAGWLPALFNQTHAFPFDHGESGTNACRVCHPANLATYDCYTCHEHNPVEIEREHRKEGISDLQDCARCHPTGQKEEGESRSGGDD